MPIPAPSYPESAKAGIPRAAERYKAGSAWIRVAVMSCTDPGSAAEIHSGNPFGRLTAWTLPPWQWALPEYHRSMTSPFTLTVFTLTVFTRHRSAGMILPSRMTNATPSARAPQDRVDALIVAYRYAGTASASPQRPSRRSLPSSERRAMPP